MILHIVRHGETVENLQRILQGHMPGTLTEKGIEQAHKAVESLSMMDEHFSCIVSSDLKRTVDTAMIIAGRLDLAVEKMPILRERDWGKCTGMPINEARERYYRNGKWHFPPTAETEDGIYHRAERAIEVLRQQYSQHESIIVVTHGQFARNLIAARFHCPVHEVTPLVNGEIRKLSV